MDLGNSQQGLQGRVNTLLAGVPIRSSGLSLTRKLIYCNPFLTPSSLRLFHRAMTKSLQDGINGQPEPTAK
jgi:hypothetical protein